MTPGRLRSRLAGLASERGVAALEFAIVLPTLLLCLLGLMEFARLIWTQTTINYAVQAAARYAAINTTNCGGGLPTAIQQYAASMAYGLSLPSANVTVTNLTVTNPSCGCQVTATLDFQFVVPRLFPYSQTLRATACFPT